MNECNIDFCICINRNAEDADPCPWGPDYSLPVGKRMGESYNPVFRFRICSLVDVPSRTEGSTIGTQAKIDDVNTTQFVFESPYNTATGTERVVTMEDVGVAALYKTRDTYFWGDESLSFTPFDLIPCPSTIDTSTPAPTSAPSAAPTSSAASFGDNFRKDTLLASMGLVIANAFVVLGF